MLNALKRWFSSSDTPPFAATEPLDADPASTAPLGLSPGCRITFDPALRLLLDGQSHVVLPDTVSPWSEGRIELGQAMSLRRVYMDDEDYWLQVLMTQDVPGDIIFMMYEECVTISSEAELQRLVGPGSDIGLPEYVYNDCTFVRQWGTEPGQTELTPMLEQVTTPDSRYQVRHLSMLYARDIGLTDRREFLLFSVEEDDEGVISLSTALGVTLMPSDLCIT